MGRFTVIALATAVLAGCGGGSGGGSQADRAVSACDAYAKGQLADKTYQLDTAALGKSMAAQGDGTMMLRAPIVVNPGTNAESKQTLECSVRFTDGKDAPDVMKMQFIW
jgi:hypothetical protein